MKHFILFILASFCAAFGTTHHLVVKFENSVDPVVALSDMTVVSYQQQANRNMYMITVNSDLNKQDLLSQVYNSASVESAESDQHSSVGTLESVAQVDSRVLNTANEVGDFAIIDEDEQAFVNSRVIFVLDDDSVEFANLFNQYHMTEVRAHDAWEYATGNGVVVAVLDTGVDTRHPFLVGNIVAGYDFVDNDTEPNEVRAGLDSNGNGILDEGFGHGSHVAGTLKTIAPDVSIMPIRIADSDGQADLFNLIQGLDFAIENGAQVINLSMSVSEPSPLLIEALSRARNAGVVVVTSAGNESSQSLLYPATESEVLTVTALAPSRVKARYANFSREVDIAAPGDHIISAMPGGGYVSRSGTSMSSPIVAAQAAIIFELKPTASVQYVRHRVINFAIDISDENPDNHRDLGKGMADVLDSISVQPLN